MSKYLLHSEDEIRLERDFVYHVPINDQVPRYEEIRYRGKDFARFLMENCPPSRELSLALNHIETALFYANASIARNE